MRTIVITLFICALMACKKDKPVSPNEAEAKTELLTAKPWTLAAEETFDSVTKKWTLLTGNASASAYYSYLAFNRDLTVHGKDASKGGSPSSYPILRTGWWTLGEDGITLLHNNIFMEKMKSPFAIEELSTTKLVLAGEEKAYPYGKFRYTYTHP